MKLLAFLLAFGTEVPIPTREIEVSQDEVNSVIKEMANDKTLDSFEKMKEAGQDHVLGLAFKYGQEDFQRRGKRSVSVGDVIMLTDGSLHRVLGLGWEHLPPGTDVNTLERGLQASLR